MVHSPMTHMPIRSFYLYWFSLISICKWFFESWSFSHLVKTTGTDHIELSLATAIKSIVHSLVSDLFRFFLFQNSPRKTVKRLVNQRLIASAKVLCKRQNHHRASQFLAKLLHNLKKPRKTLGNLTILHGTLNLTIHGFPCGTIPLEHHNTSRNHCGTKKITEPTWNHHGTSQCIMEPQEASQKPTKAFGRDLQDSKILVSHKKDRQIKLKCYS